MPTQMSLDEFKEDAVQSAGHLSHSHVSSYIRCPMVTYWRYEKNVKAPPASAMSFGSCTHKALEHNFNQKVYSKQDVPVSVVTDVFRDAWKEAAPQTVFDAEKDEKPDEFLDQGTVLLAKYHKEHSPHIQPALVETKFSITLPGVAREVIGYIDLIDDKEVIIDHKTSKMSPNVLTLAKDMQLTLYRMAYRTKYGHNPGGLRYDYLVRKSSKRFGFSAEIHPMPVQRGESHEYALIETFKTVADSIRLKKYYPNTTGFMCSPTSCGYWSRCQGPVMEGKHPAFFDEIREMQKVAMDKEMEARK